MSSPQPAPASTDPTIGAMDSEGRPILRGTRIVHNDRTGSVVNVRPGAGVLVFTDDLDGKLKTARVSEVRQVPNEPIPTPADLHHPPVPQANAVEIEDELADLEQKVEALAADAGEPGCEFSSNEFVKATGPCSLDRSAKHNWVEDVGGLPNYICQIARAIARGGRTIDAAIPMAINTVKKWAAGGGDVSPAVRARAAAAVAQWEAKKARARANGVEAAVLATDVLETLATEADEATERDMAMYFDMEHILTYDMRPRVLQADEMDDNGDFLVKPGTDLPPQKPSAARKARNYKRYAPGTSGGLGGQFAPGKARSSQAAKDQKDKPSQSLYSQVVGSSPRQAKAIVAELPDTKLKKLSKIIYSSDEVTPAVAAGRLVVKQEMTKRGLDVKDFGAPGGKEQKSGKQDPAQGDDPQKQGKDPNTDPLNPDAPEIGSQEILIPAPTTHNGVKMSGGPYRDGSARYADGFVWDPIAGQFRKSVDQKTKKKLNVASEDGSPMTITASAAEFVPDQFSYFWNPDTSETYRVDMASDTIEVFAPLVDEQSEPVWQSVDPDGIEAESIHRLPSIDDSATLESILGAAFVDEEEDVIEAAVETDLDVDSPEGAGEGEGPKFRIPVVIPAGVPSGDRRTVAPGALQAKELPMPLLWQKETDEGHKRSVIVGRIDAVEQLESGGLGNATGVFDTHPDAVEAARQVGGRFLTGVSGDLDFFDHTLAHDENGQEAMYITKGRLVAATLVAKPAFQEASIELIGEDGEPMPTVITAAGGPVQPPSEWFANPSLDGPTMLTVTDDGRVYGHIAEWGTPHLGNPKLRPPRSKQNYRYFNRKPVRTAEGADVFTGQLTLTGGHAELSMDPEKTVKHYDDTRSAVADVVAGEDEFGVWVAGAMRPGLSDNQLRAFRASEPSGDWRMRDGNLELCAVCQVNVAGFPVNARPRAMVASGEVVALVAAGMVGYADHQSATYARIEALQEQVNTILAEQEAQKRAAFAQTIQTALAQI